MIEALLIGAGFAFAAAIQPGPLQAYFLSSVAQRGWKATLPAALAPLVSDGPIAAAILLFLGRVPELMIRSLQAAGGLYLIYLALTSIQRWQKENGEAGVTTSAPRTLLQAAMINFFNPNVYIAWSLIIGPAIFEAWNRAPAHGIALICAFYATIVGVGAGTIFLFGTTQLLGPSRQRTLVLISAILLALLGGFQLSTGVMALNLL